MHGIKCKSNYWKHMALNAKVIIRNGHHQMPQVNMWKPCLQALTRTLSGLHRRSTHRCSPRNSTLHQRNCLHSLKTPSLLFASTISPWEYACFLPTATIFCPSGELGLFYSPFSFRLWDLVKGHSCCGGFLGCIIRKYKQRVFRNHRLICRCTEVGTAPALSTCQKLWQETLCFCASTP